MIVNKALIDNFISSIDWKAVKKYSNYFSDYRPDLIADKIDFEVFCLETGTTKLTLYPLDPKEQYVIKLPFRYINGEFFYKISHARLPLCHKESWDYCKSELEYYNLAKRARLADFFPETQLYCTKPYPIYIQEKCIDFSTFYAQHTDDLAITPSAQYTYLKETAAAHQRIWFDIFSPIWLMDVFNHYGEDKTFAFLDFLTNNELGDFHESNYGYSEIDHRPVLIDFSSFYEEEE